MDATHDAVWRETLVPDLSIFKVCGWNTFPPSNQHVLGMFCGWDWTVVVDRSSEQRAIHCDATLGTTFVTSWRSSFYAGCVCRWNTQEMERGAGDVPMEPQIEKQMGDRHAVASGGKRNNTKRTEWETSTLVKEDRRQHMKISMTNWGRQYVSSRKLQIHRHLQPCMCLLNILRVVRDKTEQSRYLCRIQVMLTMTCEFLRRMSSTRWVDEKVDTSKKCWIGTEKKMPEISGEVTWMN